MIKWENWNKIDLAIMPDMKENISSCVFSNVLDKTPALTVLILTYKRVHLLKRALESALNQKTSEFYEIIVLDDCPDDTDTYQYLISLKESYNNVSYYRNTKNLGQYPSWNRAAQLCRSKWFVLLHDDDLIKDNYLEELYSFARDTQDAGLIGVYFDTEDNRAKSLKRSYFNKLINFSVDIFVNLRNGRPIELTLKDNIKHIFVLSCTLFINRELFISVGGIDNQYYPSSDFVLSSKMNFYYKTYFLPKVLSIRGIGENESLKISVCEDAIRNAYFHTYQMIKYLKPKRSDRYYHFWSSIASVIAEIGVIGYNDVNYEKVKVECGIHPMFNLKIVRAIIFIYSRLNWGGLLLR